MASLSTCHLGVLPRIVILLNLCQTLGTRSRPEPGLVLCMDGHGKTCTQCIFIERASVCDRQNQCHVSGSISPLCYRNILQEKRPERNGICQEITVRLEILYTGE